MKKYLPALVCGFGAGVASIIPFLKSFTCCLIVPAASYFALLLYIKSGENGVSDRIKASKALFLGIMTGIFAAVFSTCFDVLITFLTRPDDIKLAVMELDKILKDMPEAGSTKGITDLLYKMSEDIQNYGFSAIYTVSMFFSSLIMDTIFGIIGGLIGMQVLNNRQKRNDSNNFQ